MASTAALPSLSQPGGGKMKKYPSTKNVDMKKVMKKTGRMYKGLPGMMKRELPKSFAEIGRDIKKGAGMAASVYMKGAKSVAKGIASKLKKPSTKGFDYHKKRRQKERMMSHNPGSSHNTKMPTSSRY